MPLSQQDEFGDFRIVVSMEDLDFVSMPLSQQDEFGGGLRF